MPVDLSAVAGEVWELYEALAEDKGLRTEAQVAPGLMVLGERNLIAQVVANLFDNAIKYCGPGDSLSARPAGRGRAAGAGGGRRRAGPARGPARRGLSTLYPRRPRPGARHQEARASWAWRWCRRSPPAGARLRLPEVARRLTVDCPFRRWPRAARRLRTASAVTNVVMTRRARRRRSCCFQAVILGA
ncbi:MAG: hypothetical protein R3D63_14740 [Paracoccaceae bacterium]